MEKKSMGKQKDCKVGKTTQRLPSQLARSADKH
jgi:hypothetical protein